MKFPISIVLLIFAVASCGPNTSSDNYDIEEALRDGRLKIELRGLRNVMTEESYGKSYMHTGSFVAIGDTAYTKRTIMVLSLIKRISGGDTTDKRDPNEFNVTAIINGVGDFKVYGGNHIKSNPWDPEKIEVSPIAIMPWEPLFSTNYSD